jgi:hypothetical protein
MLQQHLTLLLAKCKLTSNAGDLVTENTTSLNKNRRPHYTLTVWTAGVRFPAGASDFSLLHSVQTGPGAHPASYPMGTVGKAAGA